MKGKILLLGVLTSSVCFADYPDIYPFVPFKVEDIHKSVKKVSEDEHAIINFEEAAKTPSAKTRVQPWGSTYWPLNKGLIADSYESTRVGYYLERGFVSWTKNYNTFIARKNGVLKNTDRLTEGQLNTLAPSEKYDLLMGDKTFDLTNRLWAYMKAWGNKKEYGFLTNLDVLGGTSIERAKEMVSLGWYDSFEEALPFAIEQVGGLTETIAQNLVDKGESPDFLSAFSKAATIALAESDNYVLEKKNNLMALWEGICHGWSTASGIVPRPRKMVSFKLPDGRNLNFYPEDIKGLISLLWANSLIQENRWYDQDTNAPMGGGVISEGLRCNLESPGKDKWGRLYDNQKDPFNGDLAPRCVGVHPAIWHLSLVNIIGKQGRSFIVERKVSEEVDNHPMSAYTMKYFDPNTGKYSSSYKKAIRVIDKNDQFKSFRSKKAKYIIGIRTTMTYIDWRKPLRYVNDNESIDDLVKKTMLYDLELDQDFNIVGGQWRATEVGRPKNNTGPRRRAGAKPDRGNYNQPDFFWVISKDWKKYFQEEDLSAWKDTSTLPPASWKAKAMEAHDFTYKETHEMGWFKKCKVYHRRTGKMLKVPCEFEINKPQPLVNVVNKLIELSK